MLVAQRRGQRPLKRESGSDRNDGRRQYHTCQHLQQHRYDELSLSKFLIGHEEHGVLITQLQGVDSISLKNSALANAHFNRTSNEPFYRQGLGGVWKE
jgi:hypothetical protein